MRLQFAIERLEQQYSELKRFEELTDSAAKIAVEQDIRQSLADLTDIAKLCREFNRVLHNGYSQSHSGMVVHKDLIRQQIQQMKATMLNRLVSMQAEFSKLEGEL